MSTHSPLKIKIIIGSTRQNRVSDKPAYWIHNELQKRHGIEPEVLDLREYPMPFYDEPAPAMMLGGKYSNEVVKRWSEKIKDGDAYIMIAPEYNHGYPAVLKNAIDYLYSEWHNKPVGFISFGGNGGVRSVEQLRQVVLTLKMHPISNAIHIPFDMYLKLANEKAPANPDIFLPLRQGMFGDSVANFLDQLINTARVFKAESEQVIEVNLV